MSKKKIKLPSEESIKEKFLIDSYVAAIEIIAKSELAKGYYETQEGKDLLGEENAKREILQCEEAIRIKSAELEYLKQLLGQ